jgi:CBS domain-containing protein
MVTVSDLMTKKLVTVPAGTSAADAARVMNERHVGSVFIEQNDRVVGIVTESDIVEKSWEKTSRCISFRWNPS